MEGSHSPAEIADLRAEWERNNTERLKIGYYRMTDENKPVRYIYISRAYMSKPGFLDDLFIALGMPQSLEKVKSIPNMIFEIESCEDLEDWNMRLPLSKVELVGKDHIYDKKNATDLDGNGSIEKSEMKVLEYCKPLQHHQGVVETSCRRLLKGMAQGAIEAGAVFVCDSTFDHFDGRDQITEWIESSDVPVPVLGIAGPGDYTEDIYNKLLNSAVTYDPVKFSPYVEHKPFFEIDPSDWYNRKKNPIMDQDGDIQNSIPHNNMTHLIITNDMYRLEKEIDRYIPQGYVLIHGSVNATKFVCNAIQEGKPCFIFKYTGSTSDLVCEALVAVDKMLRLKRLNPNERAEPPFRTDMVADVYRHPNWLWPFEQDDIESCRLLNILLENFPDRFNPASILQIDLFNASDKKVQEQITKTMSVFFEANNKGNLLTNETAPTQKKPEKSGDGKKGASDGQGTGEDDGDDPLSKKRKESKRLKVGHYKMKDETNLVKYVYVSDVFMNRPNFLEDVFLALGIPDAFNGNITSTPNLIFNIESTNDFEDWNVRLPPFKLDLTGKDHIYDYETTDNDGNIVVEKSEMRVIEHYAPLRHYQGVIESNCRRLLKGTALACMQAGAIFQCDPCFDHFDGRDQISEWIQSSGIPVPVLGVAGKGRFTRKLYDQLKAEAEDYDPDDDNSEDNENTSYFEIDPTKWYNGEFKPRVVGEMGEIQDSIPHNDLTHLILTNDIYRLEREMNKVIPTGLLLLHGSVGATKHFCEAIQNGEPVFIFKYTGSTADLACEALASIDKMLRLKRLGRIERPEQPFRHNLKPEIYMHPNWLWPFSKDDCEICRLLNILVENFPDRYDPASVLQIDMFNTSEEKLQDQLTKTMSVVFEGVAELGGQAAEDRRLTYGWRMRHLLLFNSLRHKRRADVLQFLIILFTLLSVCAAVLFNYYSLASSGGCDNNNDQYSTARPEIKVLLRLTLILPLITTVFRGIYAALSPSTKAAMLKLGSIKAESEIYMYRTKVGSYSIRKAAVASNNGGKTKRKGGDKDDSKEDSKQKANNPRKAFSAALDVLWTDLGASDISKGGLINPPVTSDPLKDINDRIAKHAAAQDYFLATIRMTKKDTEKMKQEAQILKNDLATAELNNHRLFSNAPMTGRGTAHNRPSLAFQTSTRTRNARGIQMLSLGPTTAGSTLNETDDIDPEEAAFGEVGNAGSRNPQQQSNPMYAPSRRGSAASTMTGLRNLAHVNILDSSPVVEPDKSHMEIMYDDGLSTLTADEYVKVRLIPVLAEFTQTAPVFSRSVTTVTAIVIMLSIASSIFTAFSLTTFIPLALAFGESLTSWQSHNATEIRLMQTNGAMHQLHKLMIWWDSLSMIEKRVASNKEQLVLVTEAAVQGQVMAYSGKGSRDGKDDKDDDNQQN